MSAGTNAFGAKAGFNQSGGAHFMVLTALEPDVTSLTNSYINTITGAGSNSGGAFSNATFTKVSMSSIVGSNTNGASTLVAANKVLKDMGRTVVSAGRTFLKFAPVVAGLPSTFGVTGSPATTLTAGFASFYLEVGREGAGVPAPVVRYF